MVKTIAVVVMWKGDRGSHPVKGDRGSHAVTWKGDRGSQAVGTYW